ncbi:unnamed protein product [Pedinophyceae sp. YPF-701]|nr:unnamed protein product [Pedinophyceae sp. YPF-701]
MRGLARSGVPTPSNLATIRGHSQTNMRTGSCRLLARAVSSRLRRDVDATQQAVQAWGNQRRAGLSCRAAAQNSASSDGSDTEGPREGPASGSVDGPAVPGVRGAEAATRGRRAGAGNGDGPRVATRGPQEAVCPQLKSVRGIGPKGLQALRGVDITTRSALCRRLQSVAWEARRAGASTEVDLREHMVGFLHDHVGIRRMHARDVVTDLWDIVLQLDPDGTHVTLSVEGNIGAGKSTFLDFLHDRDVVGELRWELEHTSNYGLQGPWEMAVVPEPVDEWIALNHSSGRHNVLEAFYKDPERYAYLFQNYVLVSRWRKIRDARSRLQAQGSSPSKMMLTERSVFSDRQVFVRQLYEQDRTLRDVEMAVYDQMFDPILEENRYLVPDGFVYLKATPETCVKRMRGRDRSEEGKVKAEYIEGLHDRHAEWFLEKVKVKHLVDSEGGALRGVSREEAERWGEFMKVGVPRRHVEADSGKEAMKARPMSAKDLALPELPESIRDNVNLLVAPGHQIDLGNTHLHKDLHCIPFLTMDYDDDINISRDLDAKQHYAAQLRDFHQWVFEYNRKKRGGACPSRTASGTG